MVNLEFLINGVLVTPRSVNHALLAAEKGPTLGYIWVVLYVTKKKRFPLLLYLNFSF